MGKFVDLTGQRFGRLVVIERAGHDKRNQITWRCKCDCGNETIASGRNLKIGDKKSCGCLHNELARSKRGIPHHKLTETLNAMKARCNNPKHVAYKNYGAKGITVCEEWSNGKEGHDRFVRGALENGYKEGLTIDRKDNTKGYSPENCRWVTWNVQCANKRPRNKTGVLGVYKQQKGNGYTACITVNHKLLRIGSFRTIEEAKKARREKEIQYYGYPMGVIE